MAVTKILPRNGGLKEAIDYVLNGDKTDGHILTAHFNCDPGREYREMMKTKLETGRLDKRQCYHIIQSFKPGEITPELALEIAKAFAQEHLDGFEVVIGTHVDRHHIHSHIVFNSVNADTGEKYHSTQQSYYQQIRSISDRLCRENGLSVIVQGAPARSVSYIEWLRQSKGQPTFRSMLEADLNDAIRDANDLGHFFLLMEHKGYEIHHGGRLGFRLRGQERFQYPGRRDPLFTEDGIRAAIQGNLEQIEAGLRPVLPVRPAYQPYRKHPRYSGFLALYVHYLYLLGKIEKRQYPPRMTPHLRWEVMRFERYREQFAFLRENGVGTIFVQLAEGVIEEGWGGLGGASMLRNEEIIKIRLHAADLQPVELLFVGAVAGDTQKCAAGKALQELYGTGDWDGALVQGGTEVMFKGGAIKMDAKSGKNIVPADFLKLGEGECTLLDLPPELIIFSGEGMVHLRAVGRQAKMGKALLHGGADIGIKIQQGVIDINEDGFHEVLREYYDGKKAPV